MDSQQQSGKSESQSSKKSVFHRPVNFYYAILIVTIIGGGAAFGLLKRVPQTPAFAPPLVSDAKDKLVPVTPVGPIDDCSSVGNGGLPVKGACYLDFKNGTKITIIYTGKSEGQYAYNGKLHGIDMDETSEYSMFDTQFEENGADVARVPTITQDMNYDGVPDIQSAEHEGNGEDPAVDIFSFNTATGNFDPLLVLSSDADIDIADKQIHEGGTDSCCETHTDDLSWVNGAWITTELDTDEMSDTGERFVTYDYSLLRSSVKAPATANDIEDMGPTDVVADSDSSSSDAASGSDIDPEFLSCDDPIYLSALYNIYMYHLPSTDSAAIMHDAFLSLDPKCATTSAWGIFYTGQWEQPVPTDGSIFSDQIQGNYFIRLLSLNPQAVLKEYDASSDGTKAEFEAALSRSYLDAQGRQFLASAITALDPIQSAVSIKIETILKKLQE